MAVTSTTSPPFTVARPYEPATKLTASVVPRVNTTPSQTPRPWPGRPHTPRWRGWLGRTPRDARSRWWLGSSRQWRRAPPAASVSSRRCRDRPADDRSPVARAAGSRRGGGRRRASAEPRAHQAVEPLAHVGMLHPVEDLRAEPVREDAPGGLRGEPAAAEI